MFKVFRKVAITDIAKKFFIMGFMFVTASYLINGHSSQAACIGDEQCFNKAEKYFVLKQYDSALIDYDQMVTMFPHSKKIATAMLTHL